jgi:N-acetylated-alpha-linked acidic dipeptidase
VRVKQDARTRPIWTVTGTTRGTEEPDRWVVLGNHRDAWTFGGVDPSSGSAALMELARSLGALAKDGVRPRRTIVFASWDAEEFALTSSTEWGEQFEGELREKVIAYINVDSAAYGPNFSVTAVPALNRLIEEAAGTVTDPETQVPITDAWRHRAAQDRGIVPSSTTDGLVNNQFGGGSDYVGFLNFLGVPVADLMFSGPYGVYHSAYDTHRWVSTLGDPGFRYHAALTRVWGVMAMRLANADLLPLDYRPYARRVDEYLKELERKWAVDGPMFAGKRAEFAAVREANRRFAHAADRFAARGTVALEHDSAAELEALTAALLRAERALLDMVGLPGCSWYRHQIYAPAVTHAAATLPALAEAIERNDPAAVAEQEARLADALTRITEVLTVDRKQ